MPPIDPAKVNWDKPDPNSVTWDSPSAPPKPVNSMEPSRAGLLALGANLAGLPADLGAGLINAPLMIGGTIATALGRPDLAPEPITKPQLGSEHLKSLLRKTNVSWLNPDNPSPPNTEGALAYDLMARGAGVPGMALPAIGSIVAEKIGGPQWAPVGAVAPAAIAKTVNTVTATRRADAAAKNIVRDQTLAEAQNAGLKLPAADVNPGAIENTLETIAGKTPLRQEFTISNQYKVNELARKVLNVPPNTPLTEATLKNLRDNAAAPYREVASLSPLANSALERLKAVRNDAKDYWRKYRGPNGGDPRDRLEATKLDNQAEMIERVIEKQAIKSGRPELVNDLREARKYIARTYSIEKALNLGSGNVEAKLIGKQLDNRVPLEGDLLTIAKFAEGPGAKYSLEASKVGAPGVDSGLNASLAGGLGLGGYAAMGPKGLALGAIPFARGSLRELLASDFYQNARARPNYSGVMEPQNLAELLLQSGMIANQR